MVAAQAFRLRCRRGLSVRNSALAAFDAAFAFYFTAPHNTEYHVGMWYPYLERIGKPLDHLGAGAQTARRSRPPSPGVPVLFCDDEPVDEVVLPSMKAVFYANNGLKNSHIVRFNQLTHIQLLHGD